MTQLLLTMPTSILALIIVVLSIVGSIAGLYLAQRLVSPKILKAHNDVAGYIFSMIGVVYAVLLAFVVVAVWQQYQNVGQAVDNEANAVIVLFKLAQGLPAPSSGQIQTGIKEYTQAVITDEWNSLGRGQTHLTPAATLDHLWTVATAFEPHTTRESDLYTQLLAGIQTLHTLRRQRLQADTARIPGLLWTLLIGGAFMTIVFTFFFGSTNFRVHAVMTAALAMIIAFTLVLIFALDHPFSASVRVTPAPFRNALTIFDQAGNQ